MIKIKKKEFQKLYQIACDGWKNKFNEKFKSNLFSDSIEFEQSFIIEMKSACTKEQLPVFNKIFEKHLPKEENLFDVTTYSEVCKRLNEKEYNIKDFEQFGILTNRLFNITKILQIAKFFNGDWVSKFDGVQYNYYPWFTDGGGGFIFCGSGYADSFFCSMVAYYKDSKTSDHVGKHFIDIYKELR